MSDFQYKLNKFINRLVKNGVLDWADALKKAYPQTEIYLVGGAVRDAVLGVKDNKDFDFVVRQVKMNTLEKFLGKLGWVEKLGRNFGVLKFIPHKFENDKNFEPLDIALPRSEFSTSVGAYKDFKVRFDEKLNIEQDLLRRDFSVNSIAVLLSKSLKVIDPFDGLHAIQDKKLSCVGVPTDRLSEDYTRILRAIRFACQLDFTITPETKLAIKKLIPRLNDKNKKGEWIAPREVIAKEFLKALAENHLKTIDLCADLGLFKVLMPEVLTMQGCPQPRNYHSEGDVWQHTLLALKNLDSKKFLNFEKKLNKLLPTTKLSPLSEKLELILALFWHDLGKPVTIQTPEKDGTDRIRFNDHDNVGADLAQKICDRLALSAPEKYGISAEQIGWLIRKHMLLIHGHPSEFKPTTVEKYFFSEKYSGLNLIKLAWLDISATITDQGPLNYDLVEALLKRIKAMRRLVKEKKNKIGLPPHFLSGDEIMQICHIKPGSRVGEIKDKVREKQLTGKIKSKAAAKGFARKLKW